MIAKNDVTGDSIVSKPSNDMYRVGWDLVFANESGKSDLQIVDEGGYNVLIMIRGKVAISLSKKDYNALVSEILQRVTAEQVSEALKAVL